MVFLVVLERPPVVPGRRPSRPLPARPEREWSDLLTHRVAWLNGERMLAFYRVLNPDKPRHVGPPRP